MKTELPNPNHEKLKALLAKSFHSEEADNAPPLPDDLRERIWDQYGKASTPARASKWKWAESMFAHLSRLFAQPAFRGAAAALVLVAVAAVLIPKGGDETPETPSRGTLGYVGINTVLVGFENDRAKAIAELLDPKSVKIVKDLAGQIGTEGGTIVINGADRRIEGYSSPGTIIKTVPLPDSPAEIAFEVAKMAKVLKSE